MPVAQFTAADFRLLLDQTCSLPHVVPPALALLSHEPWIGADAYAGDLLNAVLGVRGEGQT
ncbi:hypothetical protein DB346_15035 [Verrucomicrobia bacterium LW23]|nr:hypothetical protein DB346_15035 [Verrucomicrobia bacterium LW23]